MRLKDVAELQRGYVALIADQKFTKKNIIALVVPFRDKYGLTDKQALCIARKEYPLFQVCEMLSKPTTNGDYVRSMNDEEMVKNFQFRTLCGYIKENESEWCETNGSCANCVSRWLKQPRRTENV